MKQNKAILVTGGLGYIGSHTVVELIKEGYNVIIIDNLINSRIEILNQIEKITGVLPIFYNYDLLNYLELEKVFKINKIDAVINFAAHLLVSESVDYPLKYYKNNLISLMNVLEVMNKFNVDNLIFSSSCTVYGEPDSFPVTENTAIKAASSPYGTTKIFGEKIIEDVTKSLSLLKAISLRYFNPVGAHETGLIGELLNGKPKHLFPIIADVIESNKSFKVYGNNYNTKDGTPIRDYIHVVDLAKAHLSALNRIFNIAEEGIEYYNIGTGNGYSVLEIIKEFEAVTKKHIAIAFEKRRDGDVEEIWADSSLAYSKLNWKPELNLASMVNSTVKWHKFQINKGWG